MKKKLRHLQTAPVLACQIGLSMGTVKMLLKAENTLIILLAYFKLWYMEAVVKDQAHIMIGSAKKSYYLSISKCTRQLPNLYYIVHGKLLQLHYFHNITEAMFTIIFCFCTGNVSGSPGSTLFTHIEKITGFTTAGNLFFYCHDIYFCWSLW